MYVSRAPRSARIMRVRVVLKSGAAVAGEIDDMIALDFFEFFQVARRIVHIMLRNPAHSCYFFIA